MIVLEMFKEWLSVERGLELVKEVLYTDSSCYVTKVLNKAGFLVKVLIDGGIERATVFVEDGDSLERVYVLTEDANLDEYKHFIDVVTIWLEMDEFDYKTLLSNSDSGKLPMLLGKLDSGNLKEVEGEEFMSILSKVVDEIKAEFGDKASEPTEGELEDLPPEEVVNRLKDIGFKVEDTIHNDDGVVKFTISYKSMLD